MLKNIIFIIFILSFWGCRSTENEQNKKQLQIKKEYHFQSGVNGSRYHKKIFYDTKSQKEYVYFFDFVTDKAVKIFDMQGKVVQEISLVPTLKVLQKIRDIQIISWDTIILNSQETNKIAFINREGKVWKDVSLDTLLTDKKGNHFELWNFEVLNATGETLIFPCGWRYNTQDIAQNKEPKDNFDHTRYFYKNEFFSPYFCKVSNLYGKKPTIEYGLYSFYGNMGNKDNLFLELPSYAYVHKKLFVYSIYSDTLYQINPENLQIQNKIKITSSYSTLRANPLDNDNTTLSNMQELSNQIGRTEGYIYDMEYDEKNKQYCVIVFHKIPLSTPQEKQGYEKRPFSVIIYDNSFKKLHEYLFDNKTHNAYSVLSSQAGIMFHRKKSTPKRKSNKNDFTTFTIFDFEK
ncbi:MAG: hypothetical protein EAZ95_05285 [Bacteroidetes bacterium]|nr:MAG: hypothetical protein EAZ95_05285 [Bacteroidota bacterium]